MSKIDSLKAAIVTADIRPKMKGDTLDYNTGHVVLQSNAMVEELLRRLPGLHIDPDGTITYNGEKIQHLMVDGEDIFGSDPTMVTHNFDATKIARVQILDRKTDQAIFTGIDDGSRTKTLNLVLKESEKDGYFGKVDGGGNTNDYYNVSGAAAGFKRKEQFTALGIAANTGVVGFGSNSNGAQVSFLNGNADALGASAGVGIPRFDAVALHYANTWNGLGAHFAANYQYSLYSSEPVTNSETLQTQSDSVYRQDQSSHSTNQQDQHWVYGIYDWAPTTISAFRFIFHGNNFQGQNQLGAFGNSSFNDTQVNSSLRSIHDNVSRQDIGGEISWRIKMGKDANRIFSTTGGMTKINNTTEGYLYSVNQFYQVNVQSQSVDTVDQLKIVSSHYLNIDGSLNFTEPVWKGALMGLMYSIRHTGDDPLQSTYNRGNGKYEQIVDSLSSQVKTETINQRATLNLQVRTGRVSYTIGSDVIWYCYRQMDLIADSSLHLHYAYIAPRAIFNYTPSQNTNYGLNYSAWATQPTLAQLMPVTNNNDPLHIALGNPGLKPGLNQNLRLEFHRFKNYFINLILNLGLTDNAISTQTNTDSLGRQVSRPVNVDGGRTAALNFLVNKKFLDFQVGFHAIANYARTVNYINGDLNRNDAYMGGVGFSLNRFVANEYSLESNTKFTYFDQVSSINTSAPVRYWTQSHTGSVTLFFIRNYEFNTNAIYTWQEKTSAFASNTSVLLWNAYVSRNFLHDKLVAKFQFNNILNANAGITRTNSGNVNTQSSTNILGRYWMISATYHFDKKFKKK